MEASSVWLANETQAQEDPWRSYMEVRIRESQGHLFLLGTALSIFYFRIRNTHIEKFW